MKLKHSEADVIDEIEYRFFPKSRYTIEKSRIDFAVRDKQSGAYLYWAEAKKLYNNSKWKMLAQLILTIKKEMLDKGELPPPFIGCFDAGEITFIEFYHIQDILRASDFNWTDKASDPSENNEEIVKRILDGKEYSFIWNSDAKDVDRDDNKDNIKGYAEEVKTFIKNNLFYKPLDSGGAFPIQVIQIDKNNFVQIFNKWVKEVLPQIPISKRLYDIGIIGGDFFLADLLSIDNKTISDKLKVLLHDDQYQIQEDIKNLLKSAIADFKIALIRFKDFKDKGAMHKKFWSYYKRPPKDEYHKYILSRRYLLVPSNIRERKGDFFTPQIWVEKSQEYLAKVFGEDWQEDYYIWDCCAGTGNLEEGLSNPQNIWVSTDQGSQVGIMKANKRLFQNHIFQFDFLNDDFDKLPKELRDIIADPKKQEKLIIYINPPYAEAAKRGSRANTKGVALGNKTYQKFKNLIGKGANELFVQFMARIHTEIQFGKLAQFSTLKYVNAPNFVKFRQFFKAKFKAGFVVPANTFDNVKGQFPIGFLIWDMADKRSIKNVRCDAYEKNGKKIGTKRFCVEQNKQKLNDWYKSFYNASGEKIGVLHNIGNDFQQNSGVFISSDDSNNHTSIITKKNILQATIYLAVRHCIPATWLNDRDQFLYPNDKWKKDKKFQNNCLAFTLFHSQNRIKSKSKILYDASSTDASPRNLAQSQLALSFLRKQESLLKNAIPSSLSVEANKEKGYLVKMDSRGRENDNGDSHFRSNGSGAETSAGDGGTTIVNHWIPFKASQVGAGESFSSNFMSDFIKTRGEFSAESKEVFEAGKKLWTYYQKDIYNNESENVNASLYEIREHFRKRTSAGRMKSFSDNEDFQKLDDALKSALAILADKIAEKVYEYGFLRK